LGGESKGKEPLRAQGFIPHQISPRKSIRKGSENHQNGKPGRTQTSLEEPRRIIYTYHEGSYKV
jgi:hypothetical protein